MKTETKFRKGLTMIELVITMAASAIVILATGVVIVFGQTSWNRAWKSVNLQRDASFALLKISQAVQRSVSASVDANSLSLTTSDGNNITFSYAIDTNDLQLQIGARTPQTIVDGTVKSLDFITGDPNQPPNTVRINITLQDDEVETSLVSTIMMRNS